MKLSFLIAFVCAFSFTNPAQAHSIEANTFEESPEIPVTGNFASLRLFNSLDFEKGSRIFTRLGIFDNFVHYEGGNVSPIIDAGFVHVGTPGTFKITYGISSLAKQRVHLFVDGKQVPGSILSCASDSQMTSQSVLVHINETISLVALDALNLSQSAPDTLTAYLEIVQLDAD